MNKKAMSLVTLTLTIIVMVILASVITVGIKNTGIIQGTQGVIQDMDLEHFQQLANMAYARVYFSNLAKGVRRELTADEIRINMIKNGADEHKLEEYTMTVQDGDVFVTTKYNNK